MRTRTALVLVVVVASVGAAAVAGVAGWGSHADSSVSLSVRWVSDTATDISGNHHAPAAGRVAGRGMVYAPVSGRSKSPNCALVALDARSGEARWRYHVPAANCTIHSVADPTIADYDADGAKEVLATTTEESVVAFDPTTGDVEFRHPLSSYGYTHPIVTDLVGDRRPEVAVVDVRGTVYVLEPDGTTVWSHRLSTYTWGQPTAADVDADGSPELVVGLGSAGEVTVFEGDGTRRWQGSTAPSFNGSITWLTTGRLDDRPGTDVVVGTVSGVVAAVDGATGDRVWSRDFGQLAAVHAVGDGDGDGTPEVYATAKDGRLRSLNGRTGETEWTTTLTTADVPMTPPPAMGDLDGDGRPELVAVTNDGVVSVVDPETGAVLDSYERSVPIYTNPEIADVDGDGDGEAFVVYGDGRVVALDYE